MQRPLDTLIIGAGFAGLGMAIALKRAGVTDFIVVEKGDDLGGVWRDNTYPGAACDIPSHLYSFSFAPNPNWSRMFATRPEIHAYLADTARRADILDHVRLDTEVAAADWDQDRSVWTIAFADGETLTARTVISAVGQLSRPLIPAIDGHDRLRVPSFHSARWDHDTALDGKRVAVIGTGASAIQFVPAIADRVASLTVFQRTPPYIIPKPDRAYTDRERARFRRFPLLMRLHRARISLQLESRAIAFTRFAFLLRLTVGRDFRKLLSKQVSDPTLRDRLVPDYQPGCKRVLLSNDYLAALAGPNVTVVRDRISRLDENAIVTENGATHSVDAVIYGTGFSATRFLAPMRFTGRDGQDLHAAWRDGASAYLGLAVPGFPNFFMLYGPNTNLGHNSIIVMLESQIAHVMRVRSRMVATDATAVEIRRPAHERQDTRIQSRLARTVWTGCTSWYVDANGRNSVNWPGFTLTYRWLARRRGLDDYQFTRAAAGETVILPPGGRFERTNATLLRAFLAIAFKPFAGPPFTAPTQRRVVGVLSPLMPGLIGSARQTLREGDLHIRVVTPPGARRDAAILYLHGGAFCLGNPGTHRAITTRLARRAGLPVHVPDYRLAPEHPYPAAIDDALAAWRRMTSGGIDPGRILIAGDSAGGALALALALRLRDLGEASPAGVALISPVTDPAAAGDTVTTHARIDPMIRRGWLAQGLAWHACPPTATEFHPLTADLSGLPPLLIQVGDQEILLSDSRRLAAHARRCGVDVRLEVHGARWHVFHLQSFLLKSARYALAGIADFAREATSPKSESIRDRGPAAKRAKGQALETY